MGREIKTTVKQKNVSLPTDRKLERIVLFSDADNC